MIPCVILTYNFVFILLQLSTNTADYRFIFLDSQINKVGQWFRLRK